MLENLKTKTLEALAFSSLCFTSCGKVTPEETLQLNEQKVESLCTNILGEEPRRVFNLPLLSEEKNTCISLSRMEDCFLLTVEAPSYDGPKHEEPTFCCGSSLPDFFIPVTSYRISFQGSLVEGESYTVQNHRYALGDTPGWPCHYLSDPLSSSGMRVYDIEQCLYYLEEIAERQ